MNGRDICRARLLAMTKGEIFLGWLRWGRLRRQRGDGYYHVEVY